MWGKVGIHGVGAELEHTRSRTQKKMQTGHVMLRETVYIKKWPKTQEHMKEGCHMMEKHKILPNPKQMSEWSLRVTINGV